MRLSSTLCPLFFVHRPFLLTLQGLASGAEVQTALHAARLVTHRSAADVRTSSFSAQTMFAWAEPTSPHIACAREGEHCALSRSSEKPEQINKYAWSYCTAMLDMQYKLWLQGLLQQMQNCSMLWSKP